MTEQRPEEARVYWVPEIEQNPIDLSDHLAEAAPMEPVPVNPDDVTYKVVYVDELLNVPPVPEGTLTPVVDEETGELIGYAEVFYNDDGSGTFKIYGLNHNPEEQP